MSFFRTSSSSNRTVAMNVPKSTSMPGLVVGKHAGPAAVEDKLRRHGIHATKEQVQLIVQLVKELAESRSKEEETAWIDQYREREEKRRGILGHRPEGRTLAEGDALTGTAGRR